jgi:hypothetical protein
VQYQRAVSLEFQDKSNLQATPPAHSVTSPPPPSILHQHPPHLPPKTVDILLNLTGCCHCLSLSYLQLVTFVLLHQKFVFVLTHI